MAITLAEYAKQKLNLDIPEKDKEMGEMPIDTPCGEDCKKAVDAAAKYLKVADPHTTVVNPLHESVLATLEVFYYG